MPIHAEVTNGGAVLNYSVFYGLGGGVATYVDEPSEGAWFIVTNSDAVNPFAVDVVITQILPQTGGFYLYTGGSWTLTMY